MRLDALHDWKEKIVISYSKLQMFRSSHPEVFLRKGVLVICRKFTGEHPCQSAISTKLQYNFIEITLRYGCSLVNMLHIFRTHFPRNTSGWLLLNVWCFQSFLISNVYKQSKLHLKSLLTDPNKIHKNIPCSILLKL